MNDLPTLPQGAGLIPLASIIIPPNRQRENTTEYENKIKDLADSIREVGLIQPIVLESDARTLACGFTRIKALGLLGYDSAPYNLLPDLSPSSRLLVEYEENVRRNALSWQERVLAMERIHNAKVADHGAEGERWGMKQSGEIFNVSFGYIKDIVALAREIRANNERITSAPTITAAKSRMYEMIQERADAVLAKRSRSLESVTTTKPAAKPTTSRQSGLITSGLSLQRGLDDPNVATTVSQSGILPEETFTLNLNERLFHGDCLEFLASRDEEVFDLCITDIPYAIPIAEAEGRIDGIESVKDEHGVEENLELLEAWFPALFRVMKDKSHVAFFYDLEHHQWLQDQAKAAGFWVQRHPIHWVKTHSCGNRIPHIQWTKAVEHIMYLRKGTATLNNNDYAPNVVEASTTREQTMYKHPFAKPAKVIHYLLDKIGFKGGVAVEPFAGEGSIARAMIQKGVVPFCCEISDKWFPSLSVNYRDAYKKIYRDSVEFVGEPDPKDDKENTATD